MRKMIAIASAFCVCLSACHRAPDATANGSRNPGRYAGIGVFDAGRLWAETSRPNAKADPAAARLDDDEHIIVVLDSHTGEVRQCGDHSGYCVAMNPWTRTGPETMLPVKLEKHASDLVAEEHSNATSK